MGNIPAYIPIILLVFAAVATVARIRVDKWIREDQSRIDLFSKYFFIVFSSACVLMLIIYIFTNI